MSWHSRSFGITNVTDRNVLQRISNGEPVVVKGNLSKLAICICNTWRKKYELLVGRLLLGLFMLSLLLYILENYMSGVKLFYFKYRDSFWPRFWRILLYNIRKILFAFEIKLLIHNTDLCSKTKKKQISGHAYLLN